MIKLSEIYNAMYEEMKSFGSVDVYVFPPYAERDPMKSLIFIQPSISFGDVDDGELGEDGYSPRTSVYIATLSVNDEDKIPQMLDVAESIEKHFRRKNIGDCIMCQDPYTTNIGKVTTVDRFSCYVTIPFVTWTANQ